MLPSAQRGATTLVISTILVVTATLIVMFAASYSIMQQKITGNQYLNQQAYEAAEAGLEFGINYLQQNNATILASPSGGHIQNYTSTSTTNVSLPNGSKFSIVYTNPISANYNLILITSTGTSADGTATRVVQQEVQYGSVLFTPSHNAVTTKGSLVISGNGTITNTTYNSTIVLGGALTLGGNSHTVTSTGTSSTPGNIKSDIQQNNATLSAMSVPTLFSDYFGAPYATIQSQMATVMNNSVTNYSTVLNGMMGTTIWLNPPSGTANFSGSTTLGSASQPVLLIINGNMNMSGILNLNGFLFVVGATSATTDISGTLNINGGMATGDSLSISGNANITYNAAMLVDVQTSAATNYYAKVPGSWKDF